MKKSAVLIAYSHYTKEVKHRLMRAKRSLKWANSRKHLLIRRSKSGLPGPDPDKLAREYETFHDYVNRNGHHWETARKLLAVVKDLCFCLDKHRGPVARYVLTCGYIEKGAKCSICRKIHWVAAPEDRNPWAKQVLDPDNLQRVRKRK